jgi:hypothetical protein
MRKVKIGDVVEIRTRKGLAYAHYTHKHKLYGALLRVFNGIHDAPLNTYEDVVTQRPAFSVFFLLSAAVNKQIVSIVGNVAVPGEAQIFPIFRGGTVHPSTQKVEVWWLWDGEQEWRVGDLTDEQRIFPIRGVWNDTLLIERIESHWTPETDPT